jgi:hypothetical protein
MTSDNSSTSRFGKLHADAKSTETWQQCEFNVTFHACMSTKHVLYIEFTCGAMTCHVPGPNTEFM